MFFNWKNEQAKRLAKEKMENERKERKNNFLSKIVLSEPVLEEVTEKKISRYQVNILFLKNNKTVSCHGYEEQVHGRKFEMDKLPNGVDLFSIITKEQQSFIEEAFFEKIRVFKNNEYNKMLNEQWKTRDEYL